MTACVTTFFANYGASQGRGEVVDKAKKERKKNPHRGILDALRNFYLN